MKHAPAIHFLMVITFVLSACGLASPTERSTRTGQSPRPDAASTASPSIPLITPAPLATIPSPTIVLPTATSIPTITPAVANTLEPGLANETIKALMHEPIDCSAPCFWDIVPGQTTFGEAKNIIGHLGLQMESITFEGKNYSSFQYKFDSGFSFSVTLSMQTELVDNIEIRISPEKQKTGVAREWLAYSPETLATQYGTPSKVDFIADWGPGPFFAMQVYYDSVDLIVQYTGTTIIPSQKGSSKICPPITQFDTVWLWMGKNPEYPPGKGIPLEKATSMTLKEFSELMNGDPDQACFIFNGNVFH